MDSRIIYLFLKYINGQCASKELEEVAALLKGGGHREEWNAAIAEDADFVLNSGHQGELTDEEAAQLYAGIERDLRPAVVRRLMPVWLKYSAAAVLLIGLFAGGYSLLHKQTAQQTAQNQRQDLLPGSNKAILKTGYGKTYVLNNMQNGRLQQQSNATINKIADEQLAYNGSATQAAVTTVYDTLTNPRGGTNYHLELADGTRITLNAATTIRYPETFNGKQREVELISGEAYVEVAHNAAMPFQLSTHNLVIHDIGTHFNISAYADEESIRTTLTEGSIRLTRNGQSVLLRPGQQAVATYSNNAMEVKPADMEETLAWTNGLFHFDHTDLKAVMRQLSRWYNVTVVYEGTVPDYPVNGEIYRNLKASQLFEGLNYSQVKFRIEGNKIIVSNK